jgi:hypothetical protein
VVVVVVVVVVAASQLISLLLAACYWYVCFSDSLQDGEEIEKNKRQNRASRDGEGSSLIDSFESKEDAKSVQRRYLDCETSADNISSNKPKKIIL